ALLKLRTHERPDLILLDLSMPVMDGWTLADELERDENWASIPVVILSGTCEGEQQAPKRKGVPILKKPVETADLLQAIHSYCGDECHCGGTEAVPAYQ